MVEFSVIYLGLVIFVFFNLEEGKNHYCSAPDLARRFPDQELISSGLTKVSLNKRTHHKQWRIN